jgi:hypothetical protein
MKTSPFLLAAALTVLGAIPASAASDVPVAPFSAVALRGGGHVVLKHGPVQRVTLLRGDTKHTSFTVKHGNSLVIETCNWSCPHHYDLEVEITTPQLTALAISGGGEMESRGAFPRQDNLSVAVNGGGDMDTRSIPADSVSAAVNGGGDLSVRAEKALTAAVNGGGNITFWGHPAVTSAVRGGGEISRGS